MSVGSAGRFAFTESRGALKRDIATVRCISPYGQQADSRGEGTVVADGGPRYRLAKCPL